MFARFARRLLFTLSCFGLLLLLSCGGGGGSDPSSSAPTISKITLTPDSAPIDAGGGRVDSYLLLSFSDPDGDVSEIEFTVGNDSQRMAISGVSGLKTGQIQGMLTMATTSIGKLTLGVRIFDRAKHPSNALSVTFTVVPPPPTITSLNPGSVFAGGPGFTLTVTGSGFVPESKVTWNGLPRPTTYLASHTLKAEIAASDISSTGSAQIRVANPFAEGGDSHATVFTIGALQTFVTLGPANDLVWAPTHELIFASTPSTNPFNGNSILAINPATGQVKSSVFAGSEPNRLALSDDGHYLYVGLDGAATIKRFVLPDLTPDLTIPLGSDPFFGAYYAKDLQVAPGAPTTIAVSLGIASVSPSSLGGVVIFDDATPRPTRTGGWHQIGALLSTIQWGADARSLYAGNNESTGSEFYALAVNDSGVTLSRTYSSTFSGFGFNLHFDNGTGQIFADTGQVLDPTTGSLVGTFAASGPMVPVPSLHSAFFLGDAPSAYNTYRFQKFHLTQFTYKGESALPEPAGISFPGWPRRLVACGSYGLAGCGWGFPVTIYSGPFLSPLLPIQTPSKPAPRQNKAKPASPAFTVNSIHLAD